jgi:hypothetical protein
MKNSIMKFLVVANAIVFEFSSEESINLSYIDYFNRTSKYFEEEIAVAVVDESEGKESEIDNVDIVYLYITLCTLKELGNTKYGVKHFFR